MSYCKYLSNILVLPESPPENLEKFFHFDRYSGEVQTEVEEFFPLRRETVLLDYSTCRETVIGFIEEFNNELRYRTKRRSVFAVRCFSTPYTRLAQFLLNDVTRMKILANFFNKTLGISCKISAGFFENNEVGTSLGENWAYSDGKGGTLTFNNRGYVQIVFDSRHTLSEEFPVKMSAILGLLRERRVYRRICTEKITTNLQLAKYLVKLSLDRFRDKPTGMILPEYFGMTRYRTLWELVERSTSFTGDGINGEGSGYIDLFLTAFYWLQGGVVDNPSIHNGPIEAIGDTSFSEEEVNRIIPKALRNAVAEMLSNSDATEDYYLLERICEYYVEEEED